MPQKGSQKQLEDFRYDPKLLKQAYRADLKAKEMEQELKKKRIFKIIAISVSVILIFVLSFLLSQFSLFKKTKYIKTYEIEGKFVDVNTDFGVAPLSSTVFDTDLVISKSALYANLNNGEILYQKNIDEPSYIASITKLMTALVATKEFELSDTVEVKQDWYRGEDMEWSLGFDKGDSVTVKALLEGMLISSYNDPAYVLADHMDGGVDAFVEKMNGYANSLGLNDTKFNNPSGLDIAGGNISTVRDLYRLITVVYRNDFMMDTLGRGYADLTWDIGKERIYTTNALLGQFGNIAGKTGSTKLAGKCFVGITKDGYVSIVLDSNERFEDTEKFLREL
jgi:D-alanyl-D-alanine carboxypeptidase